MKRILGILAVALLAAVACGGGSTATNPAAFTGQDDQSDRLADVCQMLPVKVQNITVLGQKIEGASDVEVCVSADAGLGAKPTVNRWPDCGEPCLSIDVNGLNIKADAAVKVTYKRAGQPAEPIVFDPDPVNAGPETGRICVLGYGDPDPCTDRLTQPQSLIATSGKARINLGWQASQHTGGKDVLGYEVWRSTTGEEGTFAYAGTTSTTSFVDSNVAKGQKYYYFVVAFDADGNRSPASNTAAALAK